MKTRRRIVLKMSGEALASSASDETIDAAVVERLAGEIASARVELDLELAIVVGGGNIWRGTTGTGQGMDRTTSDTMGMLATVINALALQDAIERVGPPPASCRRSRWQRWPSPISVAEPSVTSRRGGW